MAIASMNRVVEMIINLDGIPVWDMIHLHKHTGDIIHTNLLNSTLKLSKIQTNKSRVENQLMQEKVENRAHQAQIKKLQIDLLLTEN